MQQNSNSNLATGAFTLKSVVTQITGRDDVTQKELEQVLNSLSSLRDKGLMSVTIMEDEEDLAESIVVYGIDQELVEAFHSGNLSIASLSKSIN